MQIPLTLGHSSLNEPFIVDLSGLPHLFISFSEEEQFSRIMTSFCQQLLSIETETKIQLTLALNKSNAEMVKDIIPGENLFQLFVTNVPIENVPGSSRLFIQAVFKEYKKRSAWIAKHNPQPLSKGENRFPPLIIFSDNILDLVIIGRKKSIGLYFVELLLLGPTVGIHCIVASPASYLNLLKQLMFIHPSVKILLEKNNIAIKIPPDKTLGAELILSAEGLLFFKQGNSVQYSKFYP
jgi:hypothetical protein